jgi:4-hydroxybenzoate polyprenyltransferase
MNSALRTSAIGTASAPPSWRVYLLLGRVSNLPTVWSNCLTGALLADAEASPLRVVWIAASLSLFYIAGMFLNDAFDAQYDRVQRPERPIPRGWIGEPRVVLIGIALLVAGETMLVLVGAELPGLGLLVAIVYYDWRHKRDSLSPLVMAMCRAFVYVIAAVAVASSLPPQVLVGAAVLASYVVGLSQIAKRNLAPGPTIAMLIAGISLLDAALITASGGGLTAGLVAAMGFPLTLALQRVAPGT